MTLPSPGDLGLLMRVWLVAAAIRVLKYVLPLPTLVRLSRTGVRRPAPPVNTARLRGLAARRQGGLRMPGNCLERSLGIYRLLLASGANPHVVVGMRPGQSSGAYGHVWVVLGSERFGEEDDGGSFEPVVAFDAAGRRYTPAPAERP